MKLFTFLLAAACLQAADSGIAIHTQLSRTALYPGDRLEYTVLVEHPASIEFIPDHLKKDQLAFDGFEIVDVSSNTSPLSGGRKLFQVKFVLRTFETGGAALTIPSFDLFYFRRGPSEDRGSARAETLAVPPVTIAVRSTLADPNSPIRDSKPLLRISTAEWAVPGLLGLCGLIAVIVWVTLRMAAQIRSGMWKRGVEPVHRKTWAECLEEIRAFDAGSSEEVEKFYSKASDLLRGMAAGRPGEGSSLTPKEMESSVGALLEQCDRIRYAPGGLETGMGQRSEFLRKLQSLVEGR